MLFYRNISPVYTMTQARTSPQKGSQLRGTPAAAWRAWKRRRPLGHRTKKGPDVESEGQSLGRSFGKEAHSGTHQEQETSAKEGAGFGVILAEEQLRGVAQTPGQTVAFRCPLWNIFPQRGESVPIAACTREHQGGPVTLSLKSDTSNAHPQPMTLRRGKAQPANPGREGEGYKTGRSASQLKWVLTGEDP